MRRFLTAVLMACLAIVGSGLTVVAQSPSPSPSPSPVVSLDLGVAFPSAEETGDALGTEFETMGIRADIGQLWEGAELELEAVSDAQMQFYRSVPSGGKDAPTFVIVEIVRFRSVEEAATYGDTVGTAVSDPLVGFEADLPAELVATGSFISEQGYGGSTILVQEGPFVAIVTAFRTGAQEMERASTTMTALVLEGLHRGK